MAVFIQEKAARIFEKPAARAGRGFGPSRKAGQFGKTGSVRTAKFEVVDATRINPYYSLTRIIHDGSSRGGADGRGCKAREGRIPEATCSEAAGLDQYVEEPSARMKSMRTPQTCPDPPPQQKLHE